MPARFHSGEVFACPPSDDPGHAVRAAVGRVRAAAVLDADEPLVAPPLEYDRVVLEPPGGTVERRAHIGASGVARHAVHRRALPRGHDVGMARRARRRAGVVAAGDVAPDDVLRAGGGRRAGSGRREGRLGRAARTGRPSAAGDRGAGARREKRGVEEKRGKMATDDGHDNPGGVYLTGGKGPPKPPPKSRIGLTEVERAISVLEGRHPEHEKIRRQTREAAEHRRGQLDIELSRKARARRRRRVTLALVTAVAAAAGYAAMKVAARTRTLHAALDSVEAPWLARGFAAIASNELTAKRSLEVDLPGSSCFVATATADGPLVARAEGAPIEGPRSVAWCSCEAGHVTVDAPPAAGPVGLVVLRIDAASLGGPLARSWVDLPLGAWGDGGRKCADAALDAWITSRTPGAPPGDAWFEANPARAPLRHAGLRVVATIDPPHPFEIVRAAAGECAIAIARSGEALSLRGPGGVWLVSHAPGALAWCSSTGDPLTVWRDGTGPVGVLAAPALRIGGVLGARECAEGVGVTIAPEATWLRPEDLPWDARALLRASGLSEVTASPLGVEPGPPDRRVVGLALAADASAVSEPEGVVVACDPPLAAGVRESLCAHSAPVSWFNKKDAPAGSARGVLPVWLSPLEGHREIDAVARIPELLALTRRLARDGFEATALEGVTELPDGVRIVGRAGEDAVVAVGLEPKAPWALPYFEATKGGVPWDLGDAPRVVALKPGDSVMLVASPPSTAPLSVRRTVVFRHALAP